jgi:hypothetical protein
MENTAFNRAYNASYATGYREARHDGEAQGRTEGEVRGTSRAEQDAKTGYVWQIYLPAALPGVLIGAVGGLIVQYAILLSCRNSGRLSQFATVAFVPGMRRTQAFAFLQKRTMLILEHEEKLLELELQRELTAVEISNVHDALEQMVKSVSSIDTLNQARVVELLKVEASKIISTAEKEARRARMSGESPTKPDYHTHVCPHCRKVVHFERRFAYKWINCPNEKCGRLVKLPRVLNNSNIQPRPVDER